MCGINAVEAQGCGCIFIFCHAYLIMSVLLHKMASVCKQALMTVCMYVLTFYIERNWVSTYKTVNTISIERTFSCVKCPNRFTFEKQV